ncbi:MAG: rod shape-determining protein MreD [Paracoccaceae bacterium]|nr:rod shape-determining protein MreD [Paracoccaceae bacterium]
MADRSATHLWLIRLAYVGIAFVVLFAHLLPLETTPRLFAGPDIVVALTFAWALRRPDYVPMVLVAAVMLLTDLLFQRPPGLWAALVLMATEWLKSRGGRMRDSTFAEEWLVVATALLVITVIYRLVLGVLIVSPGALLLSVIQFAMTVIAYPLVVAVSYLIFGVRHATPGDYDAMGRSL